MVDFTLTDEQKNCARWRTDFAVKEIRPSPGIDKTARGPRRSSRGVGRRP